RSEVLQARLWEHAIEAGRDEPGSIVVGLFISSLNDVIDLHSKRVVLGTRNRIPGMIWAVLYFVAVSGTFVMGHHMGLAEVVRSLAMLALALAFSAVMTVIADLDRPQDGNLRVSQQALIDLRRSMDTPAVDR